MLRNDVWTNNELNKLKAFLDLTRRLGGNIIVNRCLEEVQMMSNNYVYKTNGTCSKLMEFVIDDHDVIETLVVTGGCNGNLKGISSIVRGKHIDEVISAFKGITCGPRPTSCPDQIARALTEYKESKQH